MPWGATTHLKRMIDGNHCIRIGRLYLIHGLRTSEAFRGRNEFGFGCRDTQLTTDEGYELVLTACCLRMTTRHDLARAWDDRSAEVTACP